ncbi:hypothetical protein PISMIDRAFT_9732 [Pisolithus microcarpus 441]|uniref:Uncharacterized protein n=1 Tax=Pisolithus microcarpus 441 TaxID=765257 RepID=A0A0C9ZGK8_9AGAM|nr:hypothetical protein PISMIDRAFT_9732 [Pisolithus microcarpus 441]
MNITGALEVARAQTRSLITYAPPLANSSFILQSASVAGLLGGEEATSTVALLQVSDKRRWLGWYNSPGSYVMGRRFRRLAHSATPEVVSGPDCDPESGTEMVHIDPSLLFAHDGWSKGPAFTGAYSGSSLPETGPLASLFAKKSFSLRGITIKGRESQPVSVTVASLKQVPGLQEQMTFHHHPPLAAIVPVLASLATCITCGVYGQWYAFSMILLGIFARGSVCVFIGSGKLFFDHPKPAEGSPSGDGILGNDQELTLLKGEEHVVNAVTRGRMLFRFRSKLTCHMAEWCSILLIVQAIAQLILIPQSQLFGQLMFLISLAVSWSFNMWLSSVDKEDVRNEIFSKVLGEPSLIKFTFRNRVSAVVFLLLALSYDHRSPGNLGRLKKIMDTLLPTDAEVWEIWKETVLRKLRSGQELQFEGSDHSDLSRRDETLLKTFLKDAEAAYTAFKNHRAEIVPQEEVTNEQQAKIIPEEEVTNPNGPPLQP